MSEFIQKIQEENSRLLK